LEAPEGHQPQEEEQRREGARFGKGALGSGFLVLAALILLVIYLYWRRSSARRRLS
jgi:hypothetical protein